MGSFSGNLEFNDLKQLLTDLNGGIAPPDAEVQARISLPQARISLPHARISLPHARIHAEIRLPADAKRKMARQRESPWLRLLACWHR